ASSAGLAGWREKTTTVLSVEAGMLLGKSRAIPPPSLHSLALPGTAWPCLALPGAPIRAALIKLSWSCRRRASFPGSQHATVAGRGYASLTNLALACLQAPPAHG